MDTELSSPYLMIWFKDRVIETRLALFIAMLLAMRMPIATNPFICPPSGSFESVLCPLMAHTSASTIQLTVMWIIDSRTGK